MNYQLKFVKHGSADYQKTINLRYDILRAPLGLVFTPKQLAEEANQFHLACFEETEVVGCIVLMDKEQGKVKMRQVAVAEEKQKSGIGTLMTEYLEKWMQENNYQFVFCHARDTAVPFYKKLGYQVVGNEFEEVGIKHFRMEKWV